MTNEPTPADDAHPLDDLVLAHLLIQKEQKNPATSRLAERFAEAVRNDPQPVGIWRRIVIRLRHPRTKSYALAASLLIACLAALLGAQGQLRADKAVNEHDQTKAELKRMKISE